MLNTNVAVIVIAIVIIVYTSVILSIRNCENTLMTGAWNGSVEFCESASLRKLFIYMFDNDSLFGHSREAYIIMESDSGVLIDQLVRINFSYNMSLSPTINAEHKYNIDIDYLNNDAPEFLPDDLSIYYYPKIGKLLFVNNDTSYMTLYKDCASSDL